MFHYSRFYAVRVAPQLKGHAVAASSERIDVQLDITVSNYGHADGVATCTMMCSGGAVHLDSRTSKPTPLKKRSLGGPTAHTFSFTVAVAQDNAAANCHAKVTLHKQTLWTSVGKILAPCVIDLAAAILPHTYMPPTTTTHTIKNRAAVSTSGSADGAKTKTTRSADVLAGQGNGVGATAPTTRGYAAPPTTTAGHNTTHDGGSGGE